MATIELRSVHKNYGEVRALAGLSLDIHDGEFFVIVGPSGAGKTTTLRVIAGIESLTSGAVHIDGSDVSELSPKNRDVAMAFESFSLYPHKNVFENIAFPLRAPGNNLGEGEIAERVRGVAELLRIDTLLDRRPDQLSGGQQQRVSLARAIVREPRAFLMDEPLSHLDARIRYRMRAELRELADKIRVTSVYVTHDYVEALGLADRVAVIDHGELLQVGSPREIFDRPASTSVARMIGQPEMNLVEGRVVTTNGSAEELRFVSENGAFVVPTPADVGGLFARQGAPILIGVRPHHLRVVPWSDGEGERATVTDVEDHITKFLTLVRVGDLVLRVMAPSAPTALPGDDVAVRVAPEHCLVFDARSHQLLGTLGALP